jgi:hypothetical protein
MRQSEAKRGHGSSATDTNCLQSEGSRKEQTSTCCGLQRTDTRSGSASCNCPATVAVIWKLEIVKERNEEIPCPDLLSEQFVGVIRNSINAAAHIS